VRRRDRRAESTDRSTVSVILMPKAATQAINIFHHISSSIGIRYSLMSQRVVSAFMRFLSLIILLPASRIRGGSLYTVFLDSYTFRYCLFFCEQQKHSSDKAALLQTYQGRHQATALEIHSVAFCVDDPSTIVQR
jgi:hypothetical protein